MFGEKMQWTSWSQIKKWAKSKGFDNLVARMELNDRAWMSSGEFGRCQAQICDNLRFAKDEEEAMQIAEGYNKAFANNYGLY